MAGVRWAQGRCNSGDGRVSALPFGECVVMDALECQAKGDVLSPTGAEVWAGRVPGPSYAWEG